jgi:hypothetical protein
METNYTIKYLEHFRNNVFSPNKDTESSLPMGTGLYLICIKDLNSLPSIMKNLDFVPFEGHYILYIGISRTQGLRYRDYRNHFRGSARNSTLRKSLGVLLGLQKYYYKNKKYRFIEEHEKILTNWMKENLILYYYLTTELIDETERYLIKQISPPLNIKGNQSIKNDEFRKALLHLRNEDF